MNRIVCQDTARRQKGKNIYKVKQRGGGEGEKQREREKDGQEEKSRKDARWMVPEVLCN